MKTSSEREIKPTLSEIAALYPPALRNHEIVDIPRITYHLELVRRFVPPQGVVCDIGGGIGLFSPAVAALGYRSILVDDFSDSWHKDVDEAGFKAHRKFGVEIISRDVIAKPVDFPAHGFDAVTSFECLEHLHHSPRRLLHRLVRALKPGGVLILSVPNCCNLRKRFSMLAGTYHWSRVSDWYEPEVFRAHVREPNLSDLRYICKDLGIKVALIGGRNWLGFKSPSAWRRAATVVGDRVLRLRPSLCSNLYCAAIVGLDRNDPSTGNRIDDVSMSLSEPQVAPEITELVD